MFLRLQGFGEDEVYSLRPDAFGHVYRAVKRLDTERSILNLYTINQAVNGDKKSIEDFVKSLDVWAEKPVESRTRLQEFHGFLAKKR